MSLKSTFLAFKKSWGEEKEGEEVIWTKSKKTSTFFRETFPKIKKHKLIYLQRESSVYCMF